MQNKILIYDGTFDGFLTAVFQAFDEKLTKVNIQREEDVQPGLFSEIETITTDESKSNRVWKGLKSRLSATGSYQLYYTFLSELPGIENTMFDYVSYAFSKTQAIDKDYAHPSVLKIAQTAKMVGREKHRMEAFVRFRLTKDAIYFASIEPDFNVLPLISKHFKSRYADQRWLIYDVKRHYGLYYDLSSVATIRLDVVQGVDFTKSNTTVFCDEELEFQQLWKDYFKSTNIESRKNMKLHIRHVPKRYWKYLSEKQPY